MKIFTEQDVAAQLNPQDLIQSLKQAFIGLSRGSAIQPPQLVAGIPEGKGDTIYYTGLIADKNLIGVTVSPFLVELAEQGASPVTAYSLLLSSQTGLPVLFGDSKLLIAARTGATSVIATQAIAKSVRRVAIVGTGLVAEWHLRCLKGLADCESIILYSKSINEPAKAERRMALSNLDHRVSIGRTLEEAIHQADVVMLCTSSASPVLDPRDLPASVLVTSVSTDGPLAHEIPPASLADLNVYCDYRETTPSVAGEMVIGARDYNWDPRRIVADLPEILSSPEAFGNHSNKPKYFRSVGLGIEDFAAASLLI